MAGGTGMSYVPQGEEILSWETGGVQLNRQNKFLVGTLHIASLVQIYHSTVVIYHWGGNIGYRYLNWLSV